MSPGPETAETRWFDDDDDYIEDDDDDEEDDEDDDDDDDYIEDDDDGDDDGTADTRYSGKKLLILEGQHKDIARPGKKVAWVFLLPC